jgi:hypothetical protein
LDILEDGINGLSRMVGVDWGRMNELRNGIGWIGFAGGMDRRGCMVWVSFDRMGGVQVKKSLNG